MNLSLKYTHVFKIFSVPRTHMLVQKRDMLINSIKKHICTTLAMAYTYHSQSFSSFKLGPGFFFPSFTLPILDCNGPKLG
jgi:hypothetical protein